MRPSYFIHPLSKMDTILDENGKEVEVINSWAFASSLWYEALINNPKAISLAGELFEDSNRFVKLLFQSRSKNKERREGAVREAIAVLAAALDEELEEAFRGK